jgi:hypothetical protein
MKQVIGFNLNINGIGTILERLLTHIENLCKWLYNLIVGLLRSIGNGIAACWEWVKGLFTSNKIVIEDYV